MYSKKKIADDLIYQYGKASSWFPKMFRRPIGYFFYLTGRCNLRCKFCWQRDDRKRKENWCDAAQSELSEMEWVTITRNLPKFSYIGLSGGEATISNAFVPVLLTATQKKIPITINTNGYSVSEDLLDTIFQSSVKNISVSLDGFPDHHDSSRGFDGIFYQVVSFIDAVNRKRRGTRKIALTVKTVLTDENILYLKDFRRYCEERLKADTLNISFMKTGDHAQFTLKYCHNLREIFADKPCRLHSYQNPDRLIDVLGKVMHENKKSRCKVQIYPGMNTKKQTNHFLKRSGKGVYKPCYMPWAMMVMLPNGEVVPCLSYSLGNIKDHGYKFEAIYQSQRMSNFQKAIKSAKGNLPDSCNACCFLRVDG